MWVSAFKNPNGRANVPNELPDTNFVSQARSCAFSKVHENAVFAVYTRLATLTLRADVDIPYKAIQGEIGDLIDLVIHIKRQDGKRSVSEMLQLYSKPMKAAMKQLSLTGSESYRALPSRDSSRVPRLPR
jgi:hypothetical protein